MAAIRVPYEPNRNMNFVHVVNYLVSHKIMTLEESVSFYKLFKATEDIVLDIPDDAASEFKRALDSLNCTYE